MSSGPATIRKDLRDRINEEFIDPNVWGVLENFVYEDFALYRTAPERSYLRCSAKCLQNVSKKLLVQQSDKTTHPCGLLPFVSLHPFQSSKNEKILNGKYGESKTVVVPPDFHAQWPKPSTKQKQWFAPQPMYEIEELKDSVTKSEDGKTELKERMMQTKPAYDLLGAKERLFEKEEEILSEKKKKFRIECESFQTALNLERKEINSEKDIWLRMQQDAATYKIGLEQENQQLLKQREELSTLLMQIEVERAAFQKKIYSLQNENEDVCQELDNVKNIIISCLDDFKGSVEGFDVQKITQILTSEVARLKVENAKLADANRRQQIDMERLLREGSIPSFETQSENVTIQAHPTKEKEMAGSSIAKLSAPSKKMPKALFKNRPEGALFKIRKTTNEVANANYVPQQEQEEALASTLEALKIRNEQLSQENRTLKEENTDLRSELEYTKKELEFVQNVLQEVRTQSETPGYSEETVIFRRREHFLEQELTRTKKELRSTAVELDRARSDLRRQASAKLAENDRSGRSPTLLFQGESLWESTVALSSLDPRASDEMYKEDRKLENEIECLRRALGEQEHEVITLTSELRVATMDKDMYKHKCEYLTAASQHSRLMHQTLHELKRVASADELGDSNVQLGLLPSTVRAAEARVKSIPHTRRFAQGELESISSDVSKRSLSPTASRTASLTVFRPNPVILLTSQHATLTSVNSKATLLLTEDTTALQSMPTVKKTLHLPSETKASFPSSSSYANVSSLSDRSNGSSTISSDSGSAELYSSPEVLSPDRKSASNEIRSSQVENEPLTKPKGDLVVKGVNVPFNMALNNLLPGRLMKRRGTGVVELNQIAKLKASGLFQDIPIEKKGLFKTKREKEIALKILKGAPTKATEAISEDILTEPSGLTAPLPPKSLVAKLPLQEPHRKATESSSFKTEGESLIKVTAVEEKETGNNEISKQGIPKLKFTKEAMAKKKLVVKKKPLSPSVIPPLATSLLENTSPIKLLPANVEELFPIYEDVEMRYIATDPQTRTKLFRALIVQLQNAQTSMEELVAEIENLTARNATLEKLKVEYEHARFVLNRAEATNRELEFLNEKLTARVENLELVIVGCQVRLQRVVEIIPDAHAKGKISDVLKLMYKQNIRLKHVPTPHKEVHDIVRQLSSPAPPKLGAALASMSLKHLNSSGSFGSNYEDYVPTEPLQQHPGSSPNLLKARNLSPTSSDDGTSANNSMSSFVKEAMTHRQPSMGRHTFKSIETSSLLRRPRSKVS